MTPYEKLKSLPNVQTYLKAGITFKGLDTMANAMTDNKAAEQLQIAKRKLFKYIFERNKPSTSRL